MELAMYKIAEIFCNSGKLEFSLEDGTYIRQDSDGCWYDRDSYDLYRPVCHYGTLLGFALVEKFEEEEVELVLD